jgi:predicted nucleic acid-binding protein
LPPRFAIDSSVYLAGLRDRDRLLELRGFLARAGFLVLVAGVVALELRAGARTPGQARALDDLLQAYARRNRVIGVSFTALWEAGRVLAQLATRERRADLSRLTNDAILAASCREAGVVLITDNARDFTALQRHLRGFRFTAPWPA